LEPLEARVRDKVNHWVSRGRLTIKVTLHLAEEAWAKRARLNETLAKAYARALKKLATDLKLESEVALEALLRIPGVLQTVDDSEAAESYWAGLGLALERALKALVAMREREGAHLTRELRKRARVMRQSIKRVRRIAPDVLKRYRENLLGRIQAAGIEVGLDDDRLLKEVVIYADRSDITEELARLESHFGQFDTTLQSVEPVGRTLDFLAQEIGREVNTLGAKANDSRISNEVVLMKTELEKLREQIQNVE
jgi:uncharacterized protein (TIGR00255 family)